MAKTSIFSTDTKFARFVNKLGEIILLSILWMVCCIPIVTIGASTTAAYYTAAKVLRHNEGYEVRMFFKSFKLNFKQSLGMTILLVVVVGFLIFNFIFTQGEVSEMDFYLRIIYIGISVFVIAEYMYAFPILSRFNLKGGRILVMSLQILFRNIHYTLGILAALAAVIIGTVYGLIYWGGYFLPVVIFVFPGLIMFGITFPMEQVLRKYMPKAVEGSEEADNWYYN